MARQKLVRLRYEFEFDPNELWQRKSEFESFLGKAFGAIGVEGEFMDFVGLPNEGVVRLTKIQEPSKPQDNRPAPKPVNVQLKDVARKVGV